MKFLKKSIHHATDKLIVKFQIYILFDDMESSTNSKVAALDFAMFGWIEE